MRRSCTILLSFSLGLLVQVGFVLLGSLEARRLPSPARASHIPPWTTLYWDESHSILWAQKRGVFSDKTFVQSGNPSGAQYNPPFSYENQSAPRTSLAIVLDAYPSLEYWGHSFAIGWPLRAVGYVENAKGEQFSAIPISMSRIHLVVPTQLLIGPLVVNVLASSLVAGLLVFALSRVRQLFRRYRGRCPGCNYLLSGISTDCPECGLTLGSRKRTQGT